MNRFVLSRLGLFAVAAVAMACAGSSSPRAEAISAEPMAPGPLIASERAPAMGVPAPQIPAAVSGPPAASPPPPVMTAPAVPPPSSVGSAIPTASETPAYTGPDACHLATKGDSPVAKACREGGIKSAKAVMKDLIKGARAAGARFQCDDCHSSDTDYAQLGKGAEDKFAKLLAANRK
jgi:hypothetical protein